MPRCTPRSSARALRAPAVLAALTALALLCTACASTAQVGRGGDGVAFVDGAELADGDGSVSDEALSLRGQGLSSGEDEMSLPSAPPDTGAGGLPDMASTSGGGAREPGAQGATNRGGQEPRPASGTGQAPASDQAPGAGQAPGTTAAHTAAGADSAAGRSPGVRPAAAGAPGIDDERILLGLTYVSDGGEGNEALGAGGLSTGDMRRQWEAVLAHHNERGGVAGRRIEAVYHGMAAATSRTLEEQEQEACVKFTQDHQVFAVSSNGPTEAFAGCMTEAGVADLSAAFFTMNDESFLHAHPRYVEAASPGLNRLARMYIQGLEAAGYFEPEDPTGQVRIGLVTYDNPRYQRVVERDLRPPCKRSATTSPMFAT
jgi:hypothetical protein